MVSGVKLAATIIVLVLGCAGVMAFGFGRRDGVVRYEVRFDIVGVDGVSREGASVWETRVSRNPFGRTYHTTLRGEAITVGRRLCGRLASSGPQWSNRGRPDGDDSGKPVQGRRACVFIGFRSRQPGRHSSNDRTSSRLVEDAALRARIG